jgi:hypothetical protein
VRCVVRRCQVNHGLEGQERIAEVGPLATLAELAAVDMDRVAPRSLPLVAAEVSISGNWN